MTWPLEAFGKVTVGNFMEEDCVHPGGSDLLFQDKCVLASISSNHLLYSKHQTSRRLGK